MYFVCKDKSVAYAADFQQYSNFDIQISSAGDSQDVKYFVYGFGIAR